MAYDPYWANWANSPEGYRTATPPPIGTPLREGDIDRNALVSQPVPSVIAPQSVTPLYNPSAIVPNYGAPAPIGTGTVLANTAGNVASAASSAVNGASKVASTIGNIASGVGIVTGLIGAGMSIYNAYQARKDQKRAEAEARRQYEDYQKRVRAFQKYDRTARDVMTMVEVSGNGEFYLTHRYDKRGRCYSQGYHINYQGNSWNKAVVEFANGEVVDD